MFFKKKKDSEEEQNQQVQPEVAQQMVRDIKDEDLDDILEMDIVQGHIKKGKAEH